MCLIRELEYQKSTLGPLLLTDIDCPLLYLTTNVYVVPASLVNAPVSVVHVCSDDCMFNTHANSLIYQHDLRNNLFCYNIYCIR